MHKLDFRNVRVLVVGDVMMDRYYLGSVSRISPEAPVPVVLVKECKDTLGGAANVAANVVGLNACCTLIGLAGDDPEAKRIQNLCEEKAIRLQLVQSTRPTITKTRVVGSHQQIVRLDFEENGPLTIDENQQLIDLYQKELADADVVVLSDYGKGLCSEELCQEMIQRAQVAGVPLLVDPKGTAWEKYRGASLLTPNFKEFNEALNLSLPNADESIERYAQNLAENLGVEQLLVTRSEKGMSLWDTKDFLHLPTKAREVFDVSGAGDTVIATLATAIGAQIPMREAVSLANSAAGVVVSKSGTCPIAIEELQIELQNTSTENKILDRETLLEFLSQFKDQRVVFTNGCFDVLHRGHLEYLRKARELGDILIVALNTDSSVQKLKGPSRPINKQNDRAFLLSCLEFVDLVTFFDEETPYELLKGVRPHILVKGGDYSLEDVVGRDFAEEVVLIDFVDGYSSTSIIKKIKGDSSE